MTRSVSSPIFAVERGRERVLARPGMTEKKFESILAMQMPDEEKRKQADFIVETGHGLDHAREAVREILRQLGR